MTDQRNPLESIATEFTESLREGQQSSIDAVVESNPEMEGQLRDLLPVIRQLESARRTQVLRPGGLASLGASRPDHLGDFELIRQIGRGGMGVVLEAVQRSLGRRVALKVLPKSLLADGDQLRRFQREAKTAASLHHTNIVPVFGVGEDQGFHYYVMQRIEGHGLDRLISEDDRRLDPIQVARLGQQAASALAYAHEQNVLHRDIKPANLIVNEQLDLWVTDFGVAKAIESEAVTRTGDVVGTLRYMPPEQIVGDTDVRSDVYSLGVTLYELLAGRPAMDDASIREALVSRRPAPVPPPLRTLNSEVPRDLETILHSAMAVDPAARYQTAEAMADDLRRFIDGEPISMRPLTSMQMIARWSRHNPAIASLSALSLLLLTSIAILSTVGFVRVQASLDREQVTRHRAEVTADLASNALDQIFDRFSDSPEEHASGSQFTAAPALSDEAADLLEELVVYYDALAAHDHTEQGWNRSTLDARYAIGDIRFKLGNFGDAIDAFEAALAAPPSPTLDENSRRMREAQIRNRIGLAQRMMGHPDKARVEHRKSIALLSLNGVETESVPNEQLLRIQFQKERQFQIACSHFLLGLHIFPGMGPAAMPPEHVIELWSHSSGRPTVLQASRREGREPNDAIGPERNPDGTFQRSSPRRNLRSPQDGIQLKKAIAILRSLRATDPQQVGFTLALATSLQHYHSRGFEPPGSGLTIGSGLMLEEPVNLLRELSDRHPENDTIRFELGRALSHIDVFRLQAAQANWHTVERLEEATRHFVALSEKNPQFPKYTNAVAHTFFKLGVVLDRQAELTLGGLGREKRQAAGAAYRTAARRYAGLIRRHPDSLGYRAWYGVFLHSSAANALQARLLEQSEQLFRDSINHWEKLIELAPDVRLSWEALPIAYDSLSQTQSELGKYADAEATAEEAEMSRIYRDMKPTE